MVAVALVSVSDEDVSAVFDEAGKVVKSTALPLASIEASTEAVTTATGEDVDPVPATFCRR